jgi:hypothetical protein
VHHDVPDPRAALSDLVLDAAGDVVGVADGAAAGQLDGHEDDAAARGVADPDVGGRPARLGEDGGLDGLALRPRLVVRAATGRDPGPIDIRDTGSGRVVLVTILLPGERSVGEAHGTAATVEHDVRERCPWVADVVVHTEPEPQDEDPGRAD